MTGAEKQGGRSMQKSDRVEETWKMRQDGKRYAGRELGRMEGEIKRLGVDRSGGSA